MLLKQDGSVWAAGRNLFGQLGDGSTIARSSFTQVVMGDASDVAAGHTHSLVLKQDGSVWSTGSNVHGQLGDGTTTDRHNFVKVMPRGGKGMTGGFGHSIVLKQDGSVWATGWNLHGQFGDGSITSTSRFIPVVLVDNSGSWCMDLCAPFRFVTSWRWMNYEYSGYILMLVYSYRGCGDTINRIIRAINHTLFAIFVLFLHAFFFVCLCMHSHVNRSATQIIDHKRFSCQPNLQ